MESVSRAGDECALPGCRAPERYDRTESRMRARSPRDLTAFLIKTARAIQLFSARRDCTLANTHMPSPCRISLYMCINCIVLDPSSMGRRHRRMCYVGFVDSQRAHTHTHMLRTNQAIWSRFGRRGVCDKIRSTYSIHYCVWLQCSVVQCMYCALA